MVWSAAFNITCLSQIIHTICRTRARERNNMVQILNYTHLHERMGRSKLCNSRRYISTAGYISGCTYISPAVLIISPAVLIYNYISGCTYIPPAVLIYIRLYLYNYISTGVFIYLRLYLYISGCIFIYIYPAVFIYMYLSVLHNFDTNSAPNEHAHLIHSYIHIHIAIPYSLYFAGLNFRE